MKEYNTFDLQENLSLTQDEQFEIEKKISKEINSIHIKLRKMGGIANIFVGAVAVIVLYGYMPLRELMCWYFALAFLNLLNIAFSIYCETYPPSNHKSKNWDIFFYILLILICGFWGSVYVLFSGENIFYQLYLTAILLIVLLGFAVGAITDFLVAVIAVTGLLVPYIIFHVYKGMSILSAHVALNLGLAFSVFVLGIFMLIACHAGARIMRNFFRLSFANVMLSNKLENANKFLEQRVKERTAELEESLKLVQYQVTHDLLTDLPNHRLLVEFIEEAIREAYQKKQQFAVAFFSLNEMDKINDGLGNQASTFTIKTIAMRLQHALNTQSEDHLAKIDYKITLSRRDEFIVLLNPIYDMKIIDEWAQSFFSVLDQPVEIEEHVIKLTGSIGVSIFPKHGQDVKTLLMNADAAMILSKQWGGNRISIFQSKGNIDITKQLEIESHLYDALKNNEFRLHYQPFVDLKTGKVCGMEALVRWKSPALGYIAPMDFISLAEANGVIVSLGEWVLHTACSQVKIWHEMGFDTLKMAVNLSAKQLQQKDIGEVVKNILNTTNLNPEFLELELTETEAFKDEAIPVLKKFKAMHLSLSVDDFGTGYSGLQNLKMVSVNKIKIDKSFVQDIAGNFDSRAIIANSILLAKKMGISVLAEGVETSEQLEFLLAEGCDMIQGFYFSPAIPPDDFTELLMSGRSLSLKDADGTTI